MATTNPTIQFQEPDFSGLDKTTFNGNRRGSTASRQSTNSSNSSPFDDHDQDWTITTAEKDTWANRERRRSSVWNKIDAYPSVKPKDRTTSSGSEGRERHGSILSLFQHGKNKEGKSVLHSGESTDDWGGDDLKRTISAKSTSSYKGQERRGSVLSMWGKGKDDRGRDILLQE